eukprot:gene31871-41356_t
MHMGVESNHYTWCLKIQKPNGDSNRNPLHVAEVHFYHKRRILAKSFFNFSATSFKANSTFGVSGPPEAANDGRMDTFYHSGFVGGQKIPDSNPALIITTWENITFDTIKVFNRQDLDRNFHHYYERLIGATVTLYNSEGKQIFHKVIKSGLSYYRFEIISDPKNYSVVEPKVVSPAWTDFMDFETPKTAGRKKAVLISGGLHRFIFRQSRIGGFESGTDIFIQLYSDANATTWASKVDSSLPYDASESAIKAYFRSLGAESVHLFIYSKNEIEQLRRKIESEVDKGKLNRIQGDDYVMHWRWMPNTIMFVLRHLVFRSAMKHAMLSNLTYSHYLYQREDNVYYSEDPMILPTQEGICMKPTIPCVAVSMYCGFGALSDKIYYTNQLGAEHLFSKNWKEFISFINSWLDSYNATIRDPIRMQSERHVHQWLMRSTNTTSTTTTITPANTTSTDIEKIDFSRTEMRFTDGRLCVVKSYSSCGSAGFLDTPWMKQDLNFYYPCK